MIFDNETHHPVSQNAQYLQQARGYGRIRTDDALACYLRWFAAQRSLRGSIISPNTVRAYSYALPPAFVGITTLDQLDAIDGRELLHANVRATWGTRTPSTFNAKRAAVASALGYFATNGWISDATAVLTGLRRKPQPG